MSKFCFLFILILLLNAKADADVQFDWTYESFYYYEALQKSDSDLNPGNEILKLPYLTLTTDQRLSSKLQVNDGLVVFRPRWTYQQEKLKTEYSLLDQSSTSSKLNITDFFYEQQWTPKWMSTVGLQVYQWGPAEILSPSNTFFHFNSGQKNFTFKEKGKNLIRIQWAPRQNHQFSFIFEPVSNQESFWIAEQEFSTQYAIKYEYQSLANSNNYLGLLLGESDVADFYLAQFGQYDFDNGFSIYFDSKQALNQFYYKPVQSGLEKNMSARQNNHEISTLSVVGVRYEGDWDLRLEGIYNSLGYQEEDFNLALDSVSLPSLNQRQNVERFLKNGLEFRSKYYSYFSIRKSDFLNWSEFNLYLRSMTAFIDSSGVEQIEFEKTFGDHINLFLQSSFFRGAQNSEFRLTHQWQYALGFKLIF